jgi:hypothetical protein
VGYNIETGKFTITLAAAAVAFMTLRAALRLNSVTH